MAIAAPERPAIRLWLSLVGMPRNDAPVEYTTMENSAAQSAISAGNARQSEKSASSSQAITSTTASSANAG